MRSAIKIHLLHLVGILFPHIIDDARSKPHQGYVLSNWLVNWPIWRVVPNQYHSLKSEVVVFNFALLCFYLIQTACEMYFISRRKEGHSFNSCRSSMAFSTAQNEISDSDRAAYLSKRRRSGFN